jgi:hypothetical protein
LEEHLHQMNNSFLSSPTAPITVPPLTDFLSTSPFFLSCFLVLFFFSSSNKEKKKK